MVARAPDAGTGCRHWPNLEGKAKESTVHVCGRGSLGHVDLDTSPGSITRPPAVGDPLTATQH